MHHATDNITISAIIPAYNAAATIERAIRSVLAQTRPADEIIVIDDGSRDQTSEVVRTFGNKVRLIQQINSGGATARNTGIKKARFDWIAFLDADDEWLPEKLTRQTALAKRNPDLAWMTGNYFRSVASKNRTEPFISPAEAMQVTHGRDVMENYFHGYVQRVGGCTITMMIRKDVLMTVGGFREEMRRGHDEDLWWRISYHHPRYGYDVQPLAIYHLETPDSLSWKPKPLAFLEDMVGRHLELSAQWGQESQFLPVAKLMVRSWMRASLFDDRIYTNKACQRRFAHLLPMWHRGWMNLLTLWPSATLATCRTLSHISQRLNLRRKLFHPTLR